MSHDETIKQLTTKRYMVELIKTPSDLYIVKYESKRYGEPKYSEAIKDYKTASYFFDLKIEELEGN